jgi:uncharacterized protein (TIGR01777 family)
MADGAGAIVNLAGENVSQHWTPTIKQVILQSRLDAGRAVVEAITMSDIKPRLVVQASGIGYYGPHGDEILDESFQGGTDFLANVARQWQVSTKMVKTMGVRHVIIRTGELLERDGGILRRLVIPFRLFVGPLGSSWVWFSRIHRDGEVVAIQFLTDNEDLRGVFNLTAPEPLTMRSFCCLLGQGTGRPSWLPLPDFALRLLFGEMAEALLLSGQRVLPKRLQEVGFPIQVPNR